MREDGAAEPTGSSANPEMLVVGVGASAGGIKALREFFAQVPATGGIAYVVILHLSPDYDSKLAEVLQMTVPFPVMQVTQPVRIAPDRVYVIPPNKRLDIVEGMLTPSDFTRAEQRRSPVDLFFRALARGYDAKAVAVVLSGTGADGSAGLKDIKECGGLVVAQDPAQAEYADMPHNAVATGLVDLVLPVEEMAARIVAYHDQSRRASQFKAALEGDDATALRDILSVLKTRTGNDFSNYKPTTVLRRIQRRMSVTGVTTLASYARHVREQQEEPARLMKELLISVTHFFRDPEAFAALEQRLIPLLCDAKGADDQLRIWVPACATGEEAYSIAMLVAGHLEDRLDAPAVQIFATDLDEQAVARARNGCYSSADIADLPDARLERFFQRAVGGYRVRRELRELVLFAHHNMVRDPPFSHLDLVSCRNLLIYLNRTAQDRVIQICHYALRPGGYLLLGPSESTDSSSHLFMPVDGELQLYQARPGASRPAVSDLSPALPARVPRLPEPRQVERFAPLDAHHRLLEEYAPPSLVVTEEQVIVHMSARVGRFLQLPAGEPSRDLIKLLRPELRADVRTALHQSARLRTSIEVAPIPFNLEGSSRSVDITIRPVLREDDPARGLFLVLFDDREEMEGRRQARTIAPVPEPVAQLEDELARVKEHLRTTIQQYEAQVEEAQASAEEHQATNEELRSSAEELETSKEELQSVNEELTTVNQELKIKLEELRQSNNDFQNLINSTDIATIFVDRNLHVKLATPRVRDIFNLLQSDIGRPLSDITTRLRDAQMERDMRQVLDTLQPVDRDVQAADGTWYLMSIRPYRTIDDRIEGVVVMFQDVTLRRQAEATVLRSEERLRLLIDSAVDYAIFTMTETGHIDSWNSGAERMFGYTSEEIIGRNFDTLFTVEDRARGTAQNELETARRAGRALDERYHLRRDGTLFYASGVTTRLGGGGPLGFAKIARDLTGQQQAAHALRDAHSALESRVIERTRALADEVTSHQAAQTHVVNLLRKVVTAQEDERGRIARNLHDQLGQRLTALRLSLERILATFGAHGHAAEELERTLALVHTIDAEVGFLAWELRPAILDHLGLGVALPRYVREWSEHYAIEARYKSEPLDSTPMSREAEIALYRIAQEALTNVAKHAHASRVDVLLEARDGSIILVIEDDGVGFDAENTSHRERGIGLLGMRERAGLISAEFELESASGEGTSIFVRYSPSANEAEGALET